MVIEEEDPDLRLLPTRVHAATVRPRRTRPVRAESPSSAARRRRHGRGTADGLAAVAGSLGLATGSIDLGPETSSRIPAASPLLGAIALGVVVAVPMGAAAVAGWRRSPWTADLAILAGAALIGWIVVEIAVIRAFSWLQPACAVYGAAVLALGLLLRRSDRSSGAW